MAGLKPHGRTTTLAELRTCFKTLKTRLCLYAGRHDRDRNALCSTAVRQVFDNPSAQMPSRRTNVEEKQNKSRTLPEPVPNTSRTIVEENLKK
ncbi:MAG: hypothetical protein V4721_06200 [Bacteroidota bacterium]